MKTFSKQFLHELRNRIDILEFLKKYIKIKKNENGFYAECPFHEDPDNSFCIVPDSGKYMCCSCHAEGDAISFLMIHKLMKFDDAVELLANMFNLSIQDLENLAESKEFKDKFQFLYPFERYAHDVWYFAALLSDGTAVAFQTLELRGEDYFCLHLYENKDLDKEFAYAFGKKLVGASCNRTEMIVSKDHIIAICEYMDT